MDAKEATKLMTEPAKLKEPGWLIEIRGYTYHQDGEQFVLKTLVENLAYPENIYPDLYPKAADAKKKKLDPLKTQVRDRLRYVFLYRSALDTNPQPGVFRLIKYSYLKNILSGGMRKDQAARSRDRWTVLGRVAAEAMGLGDIPKPFDPRKAIRRPPVEIKDKEKPNGGLVLTPRTEFVIYFVWLEPLGGTPIRDQPIQSSKYATSHWFAGHGTRNNKREKPLLLALDKQFQVDYVRGGVPTYDVDREGKILHAFKPPEGKEKVAKKGNQKVWDGEPVHQLRPTRMVVVSGTFPYQEQVAEYQKVLGIPLVDDLFAKNLQPRFRGFNVLRIECSPASR